MKQHYLMFEALLAREGGLYTFGDIMDFIKAGRMQSFAHDDTWVVTQVNEFPRRRVLNINYVVGDINELYRLEDEIVAFAKSIGADMLSASGRLGWKKKMSTGWGEYALYMRREI